LDLPEVKAIKPCNRWNIDKAGIMEGQGVNGLVVESASQRFVQRKQPGSRAWTSFLEGISALGQNLPPLVIFKEKSVQQKWFPKQLNDLRIGSLQQLRTVGLLIIQLLNDLQKPLFLSRVASNLVQSKDQFITRRKY
jgi:hypothetical protein